MQIRETDHVTLREREEKTNQTIAGGEGGSVVFDIPPLSVRTAKYENNAHLEPRSPRHP